MALYTDSFVSRGQGTLQTPIRRIRPVPLSRHLLGLKALDLDHHIQLHIADFYCLKHVLVTHKSHGPIYRSHWWQILGTKRPSWLLERLNLHRLFDCALLIRLRTNNRPFFNKFNGCLHDNRAINDCVLAMAWTFVLYAGYVSHCQHVSVPCAHRAPCNLPQVVRKSLLR